MDRDEKLQLSANEGHGYTFRHGVFVRFYEQSLYWFSAHIKPLKPMLERVKGGEPVVYGGLPIASFEKLLAERLLYTEATETGWKWEYAKQAVGAHEDFLGYAAWREEALARQTLQPNPASGRDVLQEIRNFNLAANTPIQTMSAVADWQEYLKNWEGAR